MVLRTSVKSASSSPVAGTGRRRERFSILTFKAAAVISFTGFNARPAKAKLRLAQAITITRGLKLSKKQTHEIQGVCWTLVIEVPTSQVEGLAVDRKAPMQHPQIGGAQMQSET